MKCGSSYCAGCYEVAPGVWVHPPKHGACLSDPHCEICRPGAPKKCGDLSCKVCGMGIPPLTTGPLVCRCYSGDRCSCRGGDKCACICSLGVPREECAVCGRAA